MLHRLTNNKVNNEFLPVRPRHTSAQPPAAEPCAAGVRPGRMQSGKRWSSWARRRAGLAGSADELVQLALVQDEVLPVVELGELAVDVGGHEAMAVVCRQAGRHGGGSA